MKTKAQSYPVKFDVDYPKKLNRLTTLLRLVWVLPVLVILVLLSGSGGETVVDEAGRRTSTSDGGIAAGLFLATALMIVFRQKYPKWWFDFNLELNRFSSRVGTYLLLLTDRYPSTDEKQSVTLDIDYPNAKQGLNRWLPLVKWLLAIPHYLVLLVLILCALPVTLFAWAAILVTGRYPKTLFDFMVGVGRWNMRVTAYAFLLVTDKYPPFSLK